MNINIAIVSKLLYLDKNEQNILILLIENNSQLKNDMNVFKEKYNKNLKLDKYDYQFLHFIKNIINIKNIKNIKQVNRIQVYKRHLQNYENIETVPRTPSPSPEQILYKKI